MKRQTKRRGAFGAAALATFAAFAFLTSSASAQVDAFDWKFDATGATLVGVKDKKLTSARIPATVDGKPVVAVGVQAFRNCAALETVEFPEGLTSIGNSAFNRCFALKTVEFPASLETIGGCAFELCKALDRKSVV